MQLTVMTKAEKAVHEGMSLTQAMNLLEGMGIEGEGCTRCVSTLDGKHYALMVISNQILEKPELQGGITICLDELEAYLFGKGDFDD